MLVLSRKEDESIIIYPSLGVDPDMTVAKLFKDGSIRLKLGIVERRQAKVCIDAARPLQISRAELVMAECVLTVLLLHTGSGRLRC